MQHPLGAPNQAQGTGCCLGKEPLLREQDIKHKVCFTPGHCTSCTQTRSIRGTPVFPVFSQTKQQGKQWLHVCQWCVQGFHSQLQIYSLREIPMAEKSPSWPGCGPSAWTAQALFLAAFLHKPAPQALVALLLCSPSPSQDKCTCKQSQGVFTRLPAPTGHINTFLYQTARTEVKASPSLLLTTKQLWEEQPEPNPGTSLFSFNVNWLLDFWTDKFGVVVVFKGGKEKNWVNCYHLYLIQFSIWLVKYLFFFFSPLSLFWKSILLKFLFNYKLVKWNSWDTGSVAGLGDKRVLLHSCSSHFSLSKEELLWRDSPFPGSISAQGKL